MLKRHLDGHMTFVCFCNQRFGSLKALLNHRTSHRPAGEGFSCKECKKVFRTAKGLVLHKIKHADQQNDAFMKQKQKRPASLPPIMPTTTFPGYPGEAITKKTKSQATIGEVAPLKKTKKKKKKAPTDDPGLKLPPITTKKIDTGGQHDDTITSLPPPPIETLIITTPPNNAQRNTVSPVHSTDEG